MRNEEWFEFTKVAIKKLENPPNKLADNIAIGPTPGNPKEHSLEEIEWELKTLFTKCMRSQARNRHKLYVFEQWAEAFFGEPESPWDWLEVLLVWLFPS